MENKTINFIRKMWTESVTPTIQSFTAKNKENTDKIVKALEDKEEISVNNLEEIVEPLLEAQNATTKAIKDIPVQVFPEVSFDSLESKIEALKRVLEDKKMEVNIGETKLELKPVIEAIKKIKLEVPKMEKQEVIDYTMMFSEMMDIMEKPQDHTHMIEMKNIMSKAAKTEDIAILAEYLQTLIDKPVKEFPELKFTKEGRLKVEVDRAGGGGSSGLTSIETGYLKTIADNSGGGGGGYEVVGLKNADDTRINPATEETQLDVLAAVQAGVSVQFNYVQSSLDATYKYYGFASTTGWKIKRKTLATGIWEIAYGIGTYNDAWADRENKTYIYA